ncbi:HNH endonuclease [Clavibacter michiganensis]|uniref:HNH endonuclease family protein n=1 Tax=Clavibacter michiganensis TaxID=28447 RepID=UPI000CE76D78|nr:HNH endonuclease family protein [Clavibacter michiganensis]PPF91301.1 HNH endonuclease [Clavibacter michiganensis]PPF99343.1 HNH endonuclease [Clavibacter michiganensis]
MTLVCSLVGAGLPITVVAVAFDETSEMGSASVQWSPPPPATRSFADDFAEAGLTPRGIIDAKAVTALIDAAPPTTADPQASFARSAFGPPWYDADGNGCDQRDDVLARDLYAVDARPEAHHCIVLSGNLNDPYTGREIDFERGPGTSAAVGVDRIVSLRWAWDHGASTWSRERRESFASDLTNLQAVDGATMADKAERGPSAWLPPASEYQCTYAARFAYVLHASGLTVDDADRGALLATVGMCPTSEDEPGSTRPR